jgi:macrolide transport system ATP-binding/permease protein
MELIRLDNICKTYHLGQVDVPVLRGISLSIRQGEMVALMGASGSGKTTLMNILGCLDHPTSGEYWLDGQEMSGLTSDQRALVRTSKLGFVFQSFNLLSRTSAWQNVLMPLDYAVHRPSAKGSRQLAELLLDRVGLADRIDHEPSQMSGGQQQRVAIARSLVNRPSLLLADEPTGNLDSHTSVEILRMFQQLNAEGITVILVTHDPKVAAYAHRTIRIVDGQVADGENGDSPQATSQGDPVAIRSQPTIAGAADATAKNIDAPPIVLSLLDDSPHPQAPGNPVEATAAANPSPQNADAPSGDLYESIPTGASSWATAPLIPRTFRTAIRALQRNKMRSALSALGVIIAVGAVIAMMEIGQGSKTALQKTIASMGANTLMIQSGAATSGGISFGSGSVLTLTPQDAEEIEKQCPSVEKVTVLVRTKGQIVAGNRNWIPMQIQGTTPSYLAVRDWESMSEGEMFTDLDVRNNSKVCVIGETLRRELFQGESPVGKELRIQNVTFRVLGVLSRKGANMMGMDQDDIVLAPWTTIKFRVSATTVTGSSGELKSTAAGSTSSSNSVNTLNNLYPGTTSLYPAPSATQAANTPQPVRFIAIDQILAKSRSMEESAQAIEQITEVLRERHRIQKDEPNDFNLRDMAELTKALSSTSELMSGLLLVVALISLVVGGVGIMNIMLVSVTERTREIGLRMAVGARSHHILRQFLVEAVVLCLCGGAMGILVGRAASILVRAIMRWPTQISPSAIIAAVAVSAGVGIMFGFYPAWKASRLDPIEALRYE